MNELPVKPKARDCDAGRSAAKAEVKCVILQPSYIPWRGYFHQIQKADVFVFYDDVQYDARGWRHRNRIKGPHGSQWLSIPVHCRGCQQLGTPIDEIPICWDAAWNERHWSTLRAVYGRAPFFERYESVLREFYQARPRLLADFTIDSTIRLARLLGIAGTRFLRSSDLQAAGQKTDRLLAILQAIGATHYITGPSARGYLDESKLRSAGISLEYMDYDYPEYPQLFPPYDPQVSVLDLLLMTGPDAAKFIWPAAGQA